MRRKTTVFVEASTTVSLAYASEYGFGRTSGHAADSSASSWWFVMATRGGYGWMAARGCLAVCTGGWPRAFAIPGGGAGGQRDRIRR